jgi:hypothetical protein
MEKHEETRYVKRTQKITQCLLNYKLLKRDNLQLQNPQRLMAFKIEQLLLNGSENGNFDWENQTPFTMSKSPEQKIMELEAKVNSRERSHFLTSLCCR